MKQSCNLTFCHRLSHHLFQLVNRLSSGRLRPDNESSGKLRININMASIVDVVPATKDDVPAMASILQLAMRVDLMSELLFPGQIYGFQKYNDWSVASFKQAFEESSSKYFKAIDKSTGSILAFASVQYYEDDWNTDVNSITSDNTPKLTQVALPEGMNVKFGELLFGGMSAKKKQHLGGKKHAGERLQTLSYYLQRCHSNYP